MYARIRPFLERAYAKAKQGDILDLSFVVPPCQALRDVDKEDEKGKQEEEHREDEEEELSRDEEVKLLKLGLLLCDASVSLLGDESNVLLADKIRQQSVTTTTELLASCKASLGFRQSEVVEYLQKTASRWRI